MKREIEGGLSARGPRSVARRINWSLTWSHSTGTAVRSIGICPPSGMSGPSPLTAVEVRTGKLLWQDRQFSKANMVAADGKVIVLDQDGNLALTILSPQECKVLAKAQVLEKLAWTPPVLAGTKLYIRDRKTLVALELGK